jgi:hypothetical protein
LSANAVAPTINRLNWPQLYLCVALTTLATLLLELSLTRIFSVVLFYHFAFLAISIALFGLGAGGVFSYVVADRPGNLFSKLGRLSAVNGLLVVFALAAVLWQREELTNVRLAILFFTTSLPFFVSGIIVSLAISEGMERVDRVYFFDLLGAAGGCLLLDPLLRAVGGENTIIVVALLFAAAAAIWHTMAGSLGGRVASVALGLGLLGLIVGNFGKTGVLRVHYAKGQKLGNEFFVKWNSFSRIAVAPEKDSGMPTIFIDADASTGIANFDFQNLSEHERRDLQYQGPGLPYMVLPGAKTLIIGPGGGWDVARALSGGSRDITAVEINPLIARVVMKEQYPELSRRLYFRPDVHLVVEDGRSFVRRSEDKFQVIQATLVDTWASTAAGAFALSENNLYTTDAFSDYLGHLTDDGFLAFTRWGLDPPRESLRLISLGIAALARLGENDPSTHFVVVREGSVVGWAKDTVLISRKPFSAEYLARARRTIAEAHIQTIYLPDETTSNPFHDLIHSPRPAEYERQYRFDISPVSDNRPFFFYTVQPRDIWAFITESNSSSADYKINKAVPLLFGLMAVSIAATAIILALPPLLLGTRLPRRRGVLWFLLYFVCIGAGYILVEVALIQKFVLFLGHPTYALTVVIFSMLLSSGLGSFWSRRLVGQSQAKISLALAAVIILVAALAAVVSPLVAGGVGWPQWSKIATAVLLIFPAGFAMGMPFPSGLKRLEARQQSSVRWAWSLNAAASVMGSAGAIVCSIYFGLIQTLLIGAALYLLALLILRSSFGEEAA